MGTDGRADGRRRVRARRVGGPAGGAWCPGARGGGRLPERPRAGRGPAGLSPLRCPCPAPSPASEGCPGKPSPALCPAPRPRSGLRAPQVRGPAGDGCEARAAPQPRGAGGSGGPGPRSGGPAHLPRRPHPPALREILLGWCSPRGSSPPVCGSSPSPGGRAVSAHPGGCWPPAAGRRRWPSSLSPPRPLWPVSVPPRPRCVKCARFKRRRHSVRCRGRGQRGPGVSATEPPSESHREGLFFLLLFLQEVSLQT